jgi:hypothetical protein
MNFFFKEKTLNGFFGCFQEIETNSPITSTITPTKTSSEKTTTESPQSFPLWLIVIIGFSTEIPKTKIPKIEIPKVKIPKTKTPKTKFICVNVM